MQGKDSDVESLVMHDQPPGRRAGATLTAMVQLQEPDWLSRLETGFLAFGWVAWFVVLIFATVWPPPGGGPSL
jgi:hypothetical protein